MKKSGRTIFIIFILLSFPATMLQADLLDSDPACPINYSINPNPSGIDPNLGNEFEQVDHLILLAALETPTETGSNGLNADLTYEDDEEDFDLEAEFEAAAETEVFDPLSGYNRLMTNVNDKLYFWVLKPVSQGYRKVVPEGGCLAVNRFFKNLLMPVRFVNNLLQLKLKRAGIELTRFTVNSTVGILGFGDPARKWFDLEAYPEDFGQTLGHYGIGSGFHIVLPVLGPSNLRDTVGLVPNYYLDPVGYIGQFETESAIRSYDRINYTSLHIGEYESLKKDAVDLYTFIRESYEQSRKKEIEE